MPQLLKTEVHYCSLLQAASTETQPRYVQWGSSAVLKHVCGVDLVEESRQPIQRVSVEGIFSIVNRTHEMSTG